MRVPPHNTKTPDRRFVKKLLLLSTDQNRTRQAHHHKANTQNINIYNIIHSDNPLGKTQQVTQDPHIYITANFEKTYDTPLRLAKGKIKDKHDLMLEQELKAYKEEVEIKFQSSIVNQTYVFPRKGVRESEVIERYTGLTEDEGIPISIYDKTDEDLKWLKAKEKLRENVFTEKPQIVKKSQSLERKKPEVTQKRRINEGFYKVLQKLLKADPLKEAAKDPLSKESKIALYSTQRITFDDSAYGTRNDTTQPFLGQTLPAHKLKLHKVNAKTRTDIIRPGDSVLGKQSEELPSLMASETFTLGSQSKKTHVRTHTLGTSEAKNLRKIVYLKKLTEGIGASNSSNSVNKSRSNTRTMQLSDYFRNLTNQKTTNVPSRSFNKAKLVKTRGHNQLTNTLSLSTLANNTSKGALKAYNRNK